MKDAGKVEGDGCVLHSHVHSDLCPARGQQSGEQRLGRRKQKRPWPLCSWGKKEQVTEESGDLEETKRIRAPGERACRGALLTLLLTLNSAVSDPVRPSGL